MTQHRDNWVAARDMVRSRAWREGYESFRRGDDPAFGAHGRRSLAYEYGRLSAAYLRARGAQLPMVSTMRPVNEHYLPQFVDALMHIADLGEAG